jgi:hypothetical protein
MVAAMNEGDWKRLLRQVRQGFVVPVVGPQLLVGADGVPFQRKVAERLLAGYGVPADGLTPFKEIHDAVSRLKLAEAASLQDLYTDVHDAIEAVQSAEPDAVPPALEQLAAIADFRLFVTMTTDDLLARALRRRTAVNEIIHAPKLPSSEFRDLPAEWARHAGDVHLLYLFGKSRAAPVFAIHDEDLLEYAHNVMARGSQVPGVFLGALQERSLLILGPSLPDWLGRFFLRLSNKTRLSEKTRREWLVEPLANQENLAAFLRSYSADTELLPDVPPAGFVAELHARWSAAQPVGPGPGPPPEAPRGTLFFVSYSRASDLAHAEALVQGLVALGVATHEIWFDRQAIEPGENFRHEILDGIRGCRYFVPLLSDATNRRDEAFVFREWREANERRKGMNREFIVPVVVDADFDPARYTAEPAREWRDLHFGFAPGGRPDAATLATLQRLVREARRGVG